MKTLARLVIRDGGDGDGLIIGIRMENSDLIKPGKVYELVECHGEIVIKDVGDSVIESHTVKPRLLEQSWAWEIGSLLSSLGKRFFLTKNEYKTFSKD